MGGIVASDRAGGLVSGIQDTNKKRETTFQKVSGLIPFVDPSKKNSQQEYAGLYKSALNAVKEGKRFNFDGQDIDAETYLQAIRERAGDVGLSSGDIGDIEKSYKQGKLWKNRNKLQRGLGSVGEKFGEVFGKRAM